MNYKNYEIVNAKPTGGKAGKGRNKTTTLQVFEGDLLKQQFRYPVDSEHGYSNALRKAKLWVDAQLAEKERINSKRVRITLEVDQQFIRLLKAKIELTAHMRGWLHNNDEAGELDPSQVLGLLVYMEARGATEAQIAASTPFMWRPNIDLIHAERRVYENGKQIAGPTIPSSRPDLPLGGGEDYTAG